MIKSLHEIAIDFGGRFCQNQVPKSRFQEVHLTGGQVGSVQQAAPRARLLYGAARQDLARGSVPVPWCPLSPIKALGFPELREEKF